MFIRNASFTDSHHVWSDLIQKGPNAVPVYQPWSTAVVQQENVFIPS